MWILYAVYHMTEGMYKTCTSILAIQDSIRHGDITRLVPLYLLYKTLSDMETLQDLWFILIIPKTTLLMLDD